jgi:hypothetical protein
VSNPSYICEVCRARVSELRRGRCWGCYERWVEARPVGFGARCLVCPEKRRRFLKSVELFASWRPMCFNCAGVLSQLDAIPKTLEAIKAAIDRERRRRDRRWGKPDSRVFVYERRAGQRRSGRDDGPTVEDDMVIEVTFDIGAELAAELDDITQIRELVHALRPADLVS